MAGGQARNDQHFAVFHGQVTNPETLEHIPLARDRAETEKSADQVSKANRPIFDGGGNGGDNGRMEHRVTALETRLDTTLPTLATKADVAEIRHSAKADMAELRADLHKMDAGITKWIIATILGLFFGFAGLFFTMNNASKAPATSTALSSPPIIIQVPQPAGSWPTPAPPRH